MSLRTAKEHYPGAVDPVEQVLGFTYDPFTLTGRWQTKHAGGPDTDFAWRTYQAFEELLRRGNPVQIDFEEITITGLITNFVPDYKNRHDIGYTFTVSPHYRQRGTQNINNLIVAPTVNTPQKYLKDVQVPVDDALVIQAGLNRQLVRSDFVSPIDDFIADWAGKVAVIKDIIDNKFLGRAQQSVDAFNRLVGTFASLRGSAQETLTKLIHLRSDTDMAVNTVVSTLNFEVWLRGLAYQARLLISKSDTASKDLETKVSPSTLALYRPTRGENLYGISQKFYGTPHNWRQIAEKNKLRAFSLEGVEFLIIPEQK